MVTPCLHSHSQVVCPAECGDEQRNKQRYHIHDPLHDAAALKISASGYLGLHDLIRLLHKDRYESQRDRHHHGYLVDRSMHNFQRRKQRFHRVCQLIWRGRKSHNGGPDDQISKTYAHTDSLDHAFPGYLKNPLLEDNFTGRQEHIENHGYAQNDQDCPKTLQHKAERHFRQRYERYQNSRNERVAGKSPDQEHRYDKDYGS